MPDRIDHEADHQGEGNGPREIDTLRARQAVTLGRMRYVLVIGISLVVVLFAIIYLIRP